MRATAQRAAPAVAKDASPSRSGTGPGATPRAACVLHGGWVPGEAGGRFLVWAETARRTLRRRAGDHPFQLRREQLADALAEAWPSLFEAAGDASKRGSAWAVLPGDGERPAPSLELQAELDEEIAAVTGWETWRVDVVEIADPLAMLRALDQRTQVTPRTGVAQGIRIGDDLRFWSRLEASFERAVRHHEYLPAIHVAKSEAPPAPRARGNRRRKVRRTAVRFEAGWEFSATAEESIVVPFARAMPGACRALWAAKPPKSGEGPELHEPRDLLRHFLAVQLYRLVGGTRFPQSVLKSVQGSFLVQALPPAEPAHSVARNHEAPIGEHTWVQWRRWRDRMRRSALAADERVCFRLADAKGGSPDTWRLEWLLSSRRDPSLLVPLADYWGCGNSERPAARNVREVLLQLGQAARIYAKLWEGMDSEAPAEVVLDRAEALEFLRRQAPILQGAGFRVIVPAWWTATGQRRLRLRLASRSSGGAATANGAAAAGSESPALLGFDTLLAFDAQVVLDGEPITASEWRAIVAAKEGLVRLRGQWMELRGDEVSRLEEYWAADAGSQTMTVADLLRAEAGSDALEVVCEGEVGRMLGVLRGTGSLEMLDQPAGFAGELRGYQVRGFSWLAYLERLGFGACLADDMGLGKTIQVLAAVLQDKARNPDAGPTLLIAPTSVVGNWQRETRRFAPALTTCLHHGPQRVRTGEAFEEAIRGIDIVVASFGVARLDASVLQKVRWWRLVVDESQNVKNPTAAVTKAIRGIPARRRIALTGTPVENRLMDLWSLFSVLNPGFLGTMAEFRKNVERPIMRDRSRAATERLRSLVRPFILRRMKSDRAIIKDLPDKVEQNSYCNLTPEQATLYEAVVRDLEAKLRDTEESGRQGLLLSTLLRLKQICNHPAQFLQDASEFTETRSHKLARVCEMLDEIEAERESVLVFTQFTEIGKSLEALFRRRYGGAVYYLHGGTPRARREHMVEEFQDPDTEPAIFVLSLRAGGTGITLTRANHVIHFDRWWNPAVENQATDRAYRIGQRNSVFVHKMVTMGTLEERIDALIESKKKLAEDIVGGDESWLANLDNDAFRRLIALDRGDAVVG
ncbi:MAG: DEAD/DEAH box helicase [Spirochaetaceae bacterium]|nr:DEAD/DEAH box helicase [Spirochaetaceae bacterium]